MILRKKPTKQRILIIEDNKFFRSLTSKYFKRYHGIETVACRTLAAAEVAIKNDSHKTIKIALLDVHMPDGDGIHFINRLKEDRPDIENFLITSCTVEQIEGRIKEIDMPLRKVFFKGELSIAEIVNAVVSRFQTN